MPFKFTVTYTLSLLKAANRSYLLRSFGIGKTIGAGLAILLFGKLIITGDRSWVVGLLGAVILLMVSIFVAAYQLTMRRAQTRFDEMQEKSVRFTITEESVETRSDLGAAEVPWKKFVKLWRFPEYWLLFYETNAFITLTTNQMEAPVQELIIRKVQENNGDLV